MLVDSISPLASDVKTNASPALKLPPLSDAGPQGLVGAPTTDFSEMLTQMMSGVANSLHRGEAAAIAGAKGEASVQDVVDAVMSADQALQISISIRDKIVSAYLEISRMAI